MNKILEQAQNIKNDIVEYRRTIHENPEVGDTLPKTKENLVMNQQKYVKVV